MSDLEFLRRGSPPLLAIVPPDCTPLDTSKDWLLDAWVRAVAVRSNETVLSDYVPGMDVPNWVRKLWNETSIYGRIY